MSAPTLLGHSNLCGEYDSMAARPCPANSADVIRKAPQARYALVAGSSRLYVGVELSWLEFLELVGLVDQVLSDVQAKMAGRDVAFGQVLVAVVFGQFVKLSESGDDSVQDRTVGQRRVFENRVEIMGVTEG
ncbi:MAG: hypothetical protein ACYSP9_03495, partial [Planctomycetota bacterium]